MRAVSAIPYWQIIGAIGVISLFDFVRKYRGYVTVFGIVVLGVSIGKFAQQYYSLFPHTQSDSFQFALTQSIPYVRSHEHIYNRIVFSNQNNLYQSYMFFLFHSRYDPRQYLKDGGTVSGGFAESHRIGKYEFRPILWKEDRHKEKTLFIGNPSDFPLSANRVKEFHYLDGVTGVVAVTP